MICHLILALIGCGVITGYGAVRHVAKICKGETVAIVGCGGVGVNAIQAARIAGASIITAIDTSHSKQAISRQLGATDFVRLAEMQIMLPNQSQMIQAMMLCWLRWDLHL